jgi:hypothetical protein
VWVLGVCGSARNKLGLIEGLQPRPTVGDILMVIDGTAQVVQPEAVRLVMLSIAAPAALGNDDDADRLQFAQRARYSSSLNTVLNELLRRNDQLAIAAAPLVAQLQFDPQ